MNQSLLSLTIINSEKNLFQGEVESITATNKKGSFDILPYHANFITIISGEVLINKHTSNQQSFIADKAILKVYKNDVKILMGIDEETM